MALRPDALTDAIDAAFQAEWVRQNSSPLPAAGSQDRRLLFAAVARGLLTYLDAHEGDLLKSIDMRVSGGDERTYTVTKTDLDISL
jgi:hypothetical protein